MAKRQHPLRHDRPELAVLGQIGRAILEAQLDQDQLCDLIYRLAGQIVPTDHFQFGLIDGDRYQIKVWIKDGVRQPPAVFVFSEDQGVVGWLCSHRQPILVRDFEQEMESLPFRPTYQSATPPRSAVFLPLPLPNSIIGIISIQSPLPDAFSEEQVRLLTVLANQAASALNNARLYARGQRRLRDLSAIADVGRRINSILDLAQLLNQVVSLIQTHFGYYHVQIFLVPRGSDRAYFKASSGYGLNEKWQREGRSLRIGEEGIIGWVAQHAEPLLANDVSTEPRYIPDDPRTLPDTRAEIAVPLLVDGEVVGVLDVQSTEVGAFSEDDVFVLRTLADQVAVAVSSARAYEAQREEAWVTTVILQVAEVTSQADSVQAVLDAAVRVTAMLAGVESCAIWLWDEDQKCFQHGASYGLAPVNPQPADPSASARPNQPSPQDVETLSFPQGSWPMLDRIHEARSPAVIGLNNIFLPHLVQARFLGDTLSLLPLLNIGRVFGVLGVSFAADRSPRINERRMTMLGGIAQQIAAAVDNSRLSAAREEEAWVSTALLQVAEAVGRFQPLDATLAQIAHIAPLLADVDRCAILRREDGGFRVRQVHALRPGLAEAYQDALIEPGDLPLLDDVCRLGQAMMVDDTERHAKVPAAWRQRFGSRSLLVVPILLGDEVIGALLADDVFSTHTFSPRLVRILAGIASQTAVAIENARLQVQEAANVRLLHELELGHTIQHDLLPQAAPQIPGYQIVYRWRSARVVGGDFFDFMPLSEHELGLLIADVSDKGIPAALYMMFARTLLRSIAFSGRPPAAMLSRANDLIVDDSIADMFVTAYYSILDHKAHTLTFSSAGHNLAYYAPAGCAVEPMVTKGLALGIITPVTMEQKTIALKPGDLVLFYTDGVTDALNPSGAAFGEERLAALLAEHHDDSAEEIADAIDTALREFAGPNAQYDDITLVLLKREPRSQKLDTGSSKLEAGS